MIPYGISEKMGQSSIIFHIAPPFYVVEKKNARGEFLKNYSLQPSLDNRTVTSAYHVSSVRIRRNPTKIR